MKTVVFCSCLIVVAVVSGCSSSTTVSILTAPPPGRVASLDETNGAFELSRGVAIALECYEYSAEEYSGPCRDLQVTVDDDTRAVILPAHLETLSTTNRFEQGYSSIDALAERAGAIVAGVTGGATQLTVASRSSALELTLIVADVPAVADE